MQRVSEGAGRDDHREHLAREANMMMDMAGKVAFGLGVGLGLTWRVVIMIV
jgi:hypothetical protein